MAFERRMSLRPAPLLNLALDAKETPWRPACSARVARAGAAAVRLRTAAGRRVASARNRACPGDLSPCSAGDTARVGRSPSIARPRGLFRTSNRDPSRRLIGYDVIALELHRFHEGAKKARKAKK